MEKNVTKEKNAPIYAAILSFLMTGGGQVYNRQLKKFAALWVAQLFLLTIGLLTVWILIGFFFLLGAVGLWLYSIYDAYTQASKVR